MIIIPGYVFNEEETVTAAKLNDLGEPTIELEAGDVGVAALDIDELRDALGDATSNANYLRNGNFAEPYWSRGSSAVACTAGQRTFRADWWFCRPEAGTVSYSREAAGPNVASTHCARLVGDTGVTIVDFGQDIPAHLAGALRNTITISFYLYNATGAALTPTLRLETADAFNNFTSTTYRGGAMADSSVAVATWQRFDFTLDVSGFTNITNGLRVLFRMPTGALNTNAKAVRISQAKLEISDAASNFVVERDEVSEATETASDEALSRNFLANPQFAHQQWLASSIPAVENVDTFAAERWWVRAGGASGALLERTATSPGTLTAHALSVVGLVGTAAVDIGQNLEIPVTQALRRDAVFSIYVYNGTGGSFTPSLRIDTCTVSEHYDNTANQVDTVLGACASGSWTRVSHSFNGSLVTNWGNGARIMLRIPSGSLDDVAKQVTVAQAALEIGTAATEWEPLPELHRGPSGLARAQQLVIMNSGVLTISVVATDAVLRALDGQTLRTGPVNSTGNLAVNGAGGLDTGAAATGWYYIYLISDGASHAALLSLSSTAPTMPTGHRFRGLMGVCYNNAGTIRDFSQKGHLGCQTRTDVINAIAATTNRTAANAALRAATIPPNAVRISGTMGIDSATNLAGGVALYGHATRTTGRVMFNADTGPAVLLGYYAVVPFELQLDEFQVLWWETNTTTARILVQVSAYDLHH